MFFIKQGRTSAEAMGEVSNKFPECQPPICITLMGYNLIGVPRMSVILASHRPVLAYRMRMNKSEVKGVLIT